MVINCRLAKTTRQLFSQFVRTKNLTAQCQQCKKLNLNSSVNNVWQKSSLHTLSSAIEIYISIKAPYRFCFRSVNDFNMWITNVYFTCGKVLRAQWLMIQRTGCALYSDYVCDASAEAHKNLHQASCSFLNGHNYSYTILRVYNLISRMPRRNNIYVETLVCLKKTLKARVFLPW